MTTFTRMDLAISYAMQHLDAGAVLQMIPVEPHGYDALIAYADDFKEDSFIGQYALRIAQGAEMDAYTLIAVTSDSKEWIGDLHICRWPLAPEAEPMFIVAYAA